MTQTTLHTAQPAASHTPTKVSATAAPTISGHAVTLTGRGVLLSYVESATTKLRQFTGSLMVALSQVFMKNTSTTGYVPKLTPQKPQPNLPQQAGANQSTSPTRSNNLGVTDRADK